MPRQKPAPEDVPVRITVSLPTKIVMMAEAYRHRETDELIPDFSALVARALVAYAQKKHPDLLQATISHIQDVGAAETQKRLGEITVATRAKVKQPKPGDYVRANLPGKGREHGAAGKTGT